MNPIAVISLVLAGIAGATATAVVINQEDVVVGDVPFIVYQGDKPVGRAMVTREVYNNIASYVATQDGFSMVEPSATDYNLLDGVKRDVRLQDLAELEKFLDEVERLMGVER